MTIEQAAGDCAGTATSDCSGTSCCGVDVAALSLSVIPSGTSTTDITPDFTQHLHPGASVLLLGSVNQETCSRVAQAVGTAGRVIALNPRTSRVHDLRLDLERFEDYLAEHPVRTSADWQRAEAFAQELRDESPLVASDSIDVVMANDVLSLVGSSERAQIFAEVFRVLRRGGQIILNDIASDEDLADPQQQDASLQSLGLANALREDVLLTAFEDAGFYGVEVLHRQTRPHATVNGIEFRSMTVRAWKGKQGPCLDARQAVIYKGPWKMVVDDDGHKLFRGQRMAVCDKTFQIYSRSPYAEHMIPVPPATPVPLEMAPAFSCHTSAVRDPRETKATDLSLTLVPDGSCCSPGGSCC